jgi:hypothetical protein
MTALLTASRLIALAGLSAMSLPAFSAEEGELVLARQFFRCSAYYSFGSASVTRVSLKQQLTYLGQRSYNAGALLVGNNQLRAQAEFDDASKALLIEAHGARSDMAAFLKINADACTELRERSQPHAPKSSAETVRADDPPMELHETP